MLIWWGRRTGFELGHMERGVNAVPGGSCVATGGPGWAQAHPLSSVAPPNEMFSW